MKSEKQCWSWPIGWNQKTNYATCALAPILYNRHNFHTIFLGAASVFTCPAVIIFFIFRKFRKTIRLILHRNLILIIILRNLLTIMTKELIILDALLPDNSSKHVMDDNPVWCRVLAFFENVAKNGIYTCMLADGFYLHKLIVRAFAEEPNLKIVYGITFGWFLQCFRRLS